MIVFGLQTSVWGGEKSKEKEPEWDIKKAREAFNKEKKETKNKAIAEEQTRQKAIKIARGGDRTAILDLCINQEKYWGHVKADDAQALLDRAKWCEQAGKHTEAAHHRSVAKKRNLRSAYKRGDYAFIVKELLPQAKKGDQDAQVGMCIFYWHGLGIPEDGIKSLFWCNKVKKKKEHAEKVFNLVKEIATAIKVSGTPNKTEALQKLEGLANKGSAEARWLMYKAHRLRLVSIDKKDSRNGRKRWLDLAVKSNHPEALFKAAPTHIHSQSPVNPKTQKKFVNYMTRAAVQGNTRAMLQLGYFYLPDEYGRKPKKPHKNYSKAAKWYRMAAKAGDVEDSFYKLLRNNKNPERDYDEGLKWLIEAAAQKNYMEAQVKLADIYLKGEEIPRNTDRAIKLLFEAISFEYADTYIEYFAPAHHKLGNLYQYGIGVQRDYSRAEKHYRKVVEHKYANRGANYYGIAIRNLVRAANYQLGTIYAKGLGRPKDEAKAFKWYNSAAKMGEPRAQRWKEYFEAKSSDVSVSVLRSIQQNLARLNYKLGAADGVFGRKTFDSIRAFQCSKGLKISGRPSRALGALLESEKPERNNSREALTQRLYKAIGQLDIDCVNAALALGANPNTRPQRRSGPIESTSSYSGRNLEDDVAREFQFMITQTLLGAGSKISRLNSNIFSAISNGHLRLVKLLLNNGESPTRRISGASLIHWAAYYDQPAVMELLVKFGALRLSKRQIAQERITNVLSSVSGFSGIPTVKHALANGARINGQNAAGKTPLVSAVHHGVYERGNYELIKYLLDKGADPNQESKIRGRYNFVETESKTLPLHRFVCANQYTMNDDGSGRASQPNNIHVKKYATSGMHLLLKRGAKVAGRDTYGRTPLHRAADCGNLAAAKILLNAGALATHRDKKGATPVDYAETGKMIALLRNYNRRKPARPSAKSGPSSLPKATLGSGFYISKLRHIVTNAHIVNGCRLIEVGNESRKATAATVISSDKRNDLALLKTELPKQTGDSNSFSQPTGLKMVPSKQSGHLRSKDVKLGEKVIVAGYPYGEIISRTIKVTSGIVSATRGFSDDTGQFQLDAAVQPGNSGGPIFDSRGNIIGVVVARINKLKMAKAMGSIPENSNFAIKTSTLRTFLESSGVPVERLDRTKAIATELIAEIAQKQTVMIKCIR